VPIRDSTLSGVVIFGDVGGELGRRLGLGGIAARAARPRRPARRKGRNIGKLPSMG
jgi:hypothetical protein